MAKNNVAKSDEKFETEWNTTSVTISNWRRERFVDDWTVKKEEEQEEKEWKEPRD